MIDAASSTVSQNKQLQKTELNSYFSFDKLVSVEIEIKSKDYGISSLFTFPGNWKLATADEPRVQ